MRLVVLGSGTCVPSLTRNAPGYSIESPAVRLLVDCGSGTLLQLSRANKSYREIDAVFLTHTHPDHIADLIPLIHALLATPGYKREKDLFVIGPEGVKSFLSNCVATLLRSPKTFSVQVIEMEDKFEVGDIHVFSTKTVHSGNSLAYRFEEGGKSIVITGDCDYDQGIIMLSKNADLLIGDCSFPDALKVPGHMTPRECGLVAQKARVKKLLLSHIYPADSPDAERVKESRAVFDGDVSLAEDLMEFDLS